MLHAKFILYSFEYETSFFSLTLPGLKKLQGGQMGALLLRLGVHRLLQHGQDFVLVLLQKRPKRQAHVGSKCRPAAVVVVR